MFCIKWSNPFHKNVNPDQIEKMFNRFNKYTEEQCLQIGKQYYNYSLKWFVFAFMKLKTS